ncbi:MAG: hypothetical protein K6T88_06780 [Bacillus sp. (in: Bacteria)]|nr:hypothetical protein [Bacillus sp. (in: firmicutes)]
MLFISICVILVLISIVLIKKAGIINAYSKGILIATALSIIVAISLSQNYTQSLIPEANDGVGLSNKIAYWIIGEQGWSIDRFKTFFENSTYLALFLTLVYPLVLLIESKVVAKR